jgi:hypothetical protein
MNNSWNDTWRGRTEVFRESLSQCRFVHLDWLGNEPSTPRNRLSHATAHSTLLFDAFTFKVPAIGRSV